MKIVIACAAKKKPTNLGTGFRTTDNRLVKFVAHPELFTKNNEEYVYAHPDELSDGQHTWRDRLSDYNNGTPLNPLHLLPAYQLYKNKTYENLVNRFGLEQVFILSAGWGLISANFLTPDYDITFSDKAEPYCQRNKSDSYADFCQLPDDGESIVFLGGKAYQPLFLKLTKGLKGEKIIFCKSLGKPIMEDGFCFAEFPTKQKTNWYYGCAKALIDSSIRI